MKIPETSADAAFELAPLPPERESLPTLVGIVAAVGWVLLPVWIAPSGLDYWFYQRIGAFFGTVWGQTTVAAVWFGLRPGPLGGRFFGTAVWIGALTAAISAAALMNPPHDFSPAVILAGCLAGQWLILQAPLAILRRKYGVRLTRRAPVADGSPLQFGLRHLLLFTTAIAVLLAGGRVLLSLAPVRLGDHEPVTLYVLLTIGALLGTLPICLTLFLRRYVAIAWLLATAFGACVPFAEFHWIDRQILGPGGEYILGWIYVGQLLWVTTLCGLLRLHGYRLIRVGEHRP